MTHRPFLRRLTALLVAAGLLCCGLCGCGDGGRDASLAFPLAAEPRQLDPQVSEDSASREIEMALFEGLTRLDDDGTPVPAAARDWTVSADGLTYTFTLRTARWSDGSPLTAQDFVYALRRVADPATGSSLAAELRGIEGFEAVQSGAASVRHLGVSAPTEQTLILRLTAPDDTLPTRLALPPFFPCKETFFDECRGHYGLEKDYVLGNGPFTLTGWSHGTSLTLTRSDTYADAADVAPARVRYLIGAAGGLASLGEEGGLTAAPLLSAAEAEEATAKGLTVSATADTLYALWMNTKAAGLKSAAVRRALRDAVEWTALTDTPDGVTRTAATGYAVPDCLLPDGSVYRREGSALPFVCDPHAAAHLERALGDTPLPQLTLLCTEEELPLARDIVQSWQKNLRVYFLLETATEAECAARLKAGNYELALGTLTPTGSGVGEFFACFASDAPCNYARLSGKTVDAALETARTKGTRAAFEAAEQALYDACPCLPLAFVRTPYGVSASVSGVAVHPFAGGQFGAVYTYRHALKTGD